MRARRTERRSRCCGVTSRGAPTCGGRRRRNGWQVLGLVAETVVLVAVATKPWNICQSGGLQCIFEGVLP